MAGESIGAERCDEPQTAPGPAAGNERHAPPDAPDAPLAGARLAGIDALRGGALCLMFVYHFAFDLRFYRVIAADFEHDPFWLGLRAIIVSAFMALVGVSLVLADRARIAPARFWWRIGVIAACAIVVERRELDRVPALVHLFRHPAQHCRRLGPGVALRPPARNGARHRTASSSLPARAGRTRRSTPARFRGWDSSPPSRRPRTTCRSRPGGVSHSSASRWGIGSRATRSVRSRQSPRRPTGCAGWGATAWPSTWSTSRSCSACSGWLSVDEATAPIASARQPSPSADSGNEPPGMAPLGATCRIRYNSPLAGA